MSEKFTKAATGLIVGTANGVFGSGGGTLLVPALEKFLNIETHKAHATALAVIMPLSLLSILFYTRGGDTPWGTILWISAGGAAGGYIGAKLLNKLKSAWLRKLFGICMVVAAVRMIF
ncbi:MAG: sulfite exporter TauE/SafE family protein [Clostridiales bacterium]|nr:sulfite exporter TauE/SafE family protein [Clostridiales bacterium]